MKCWQDQLWWKDVEKGCSCSRQYILSVADAVFQRLGLLLVNPPLHWVRHFSMTLFPFIPRLSHFSSWNSVILFSLEKPGEEGTRDLCSSLYPITLISPPPPKKKKLKIVFQLHWWITKPRELNLLDFVHTPSRHSFIHFYSNEKFGAYLAYLFVQLTSWYFWE